MSFEKRSDLLIEIIEKNRLQSSDYEVKQEDTTNSKIYKVDSFEVKTIEQENEIGRPIGKYHLITIKNIKTLSNNSKTKIIKIVADRIKDILPKLKSNFEILVVGLGNDKIESDSLGPLVASKVIITRLLSKEERNGWPNISAITPSVMGITGIETADIINAVVDKIKPNLVIIIDSLCASSYTRLGCSIQITNTGIIPGGGVNRPKKELSKESLKCNVITIGIPLMIYAKTFGEGVSEIDENLVVTFHDVRYIVKDLSDLVAKAINYSILGIESL